MSSKADLNKKNWTPKDAQEARKRLNWTQDHVADFCGVSRRTIANYESHSVPFLYEYFLRDQLRLHDELN